MRDRAPWQPLNGTPFSSVLQSTLQNMSFSIWVDAVGVDFFKKSKDELCSTGSFIMSTRSDCHTGRRGQLTSPVEDLSLQAQQTILPPRGHTYLSRLSGFFHFCWLWQEPAPRFKNVIFAQCLERADYFCRALLRPHVDHKQIKPSWQLAYGWNQTQRGRTTSLTQDTQVHQDQLDQSTWYGENMQIPQNRNQPRKTAVECK